MKIKCCIALLLLLLLVSVACSSKIERKIVGKWALAGRMIGGSPSSFWFKAGGTVLAPWEPHLYAMQSEGTYEITEDGRLKVRMDSGYYKGNTYFFDIIRIDEKELILGNDYEEVRLRRE